MKQRKKQHSLNKKERLYRTREMDIELICILKCRSCGSKHRFDKRMNFYRCCCGKNIIWNQTINHLNSCVIYRKSNWLADNLREYNKWS